MSYDSLGSPPRKFPLAENLTIVNGLAHAIDQNYRSGETNLHVCHLLDSPYAFS